MIENYFILKLFSSKTTFTCFLNWNIKKKLLIPEGKQKEIFYAGYLKMKIQAPYFAPTHTICFEIILMSHTNHTHKPFTYKTCYVRDISMFIYTDTFTKKSSFVKKKKKKNSKKKQTNQIFFCKLLSCYIDGVAGIFIHFRKQLSVYFLVIYSIFFLCL